MTEGPESPETIASVQEPAFPDAPAAIEQGLNVPLLAVLLLVLAAVVASNVWLRRRALAERSES